MRIRPAVTLLLIALPVASCASSATRPAAAPARLIVHVTLSGGPMGADGQMALSNSPSVGSTVTAKAATGRTWSARVDARGNASFVLPKGSYRVVSSACFGARQAVLRSGFATRLSFHCDVP